jgi:hypothetical protein
VSVFSPAQLKNLPAWRVLVFCDGMAVLLGKVRPAWKRSDLKAQMKHESRAAQAVVDAVVAETEQAAAQAPTVAAWVVDDRGDAEPGEVHPVGGMGGRPVRNGRVGDAGRVGDSDVER